MTTPSQTSTEDLELLSPPMPDTLLEALHLSRNPECIDVANVTAMLNNDPLVVARLLQTVNSSLYGLSRTISSAEKAVVMLGPTHVVSLVVGMSLLRMRSALGGPAGPSFNRLIRHSIATAHLSRFLIEKLPLQHGLGRPDPTLAGIGYTAGLLHDLGKIILVYNFPEKAVALYDQYGLGQNISVSELQEAEQRLFGCDHTIAGELVAHKLNFPELLTQAILLHHRPEQATGDPIVKQLVAATTLADLAARALGHAFTSPYTWEACITEDAWAHYLPYAPPAIDTPEALAEAVFSEKEQLTPHVQAFGIAKAD